MTPGPTSACERTRSIGVRGQRAMGWERIGRGVASLAMAFGALVMMWVGFPQSAGAHSKGTTGHATVTVDGHTARLDLTLSQEGLPSPAELADAVSNHVTIGSERGLCAPVAMPVAPSLSGGTSVTVVVLYACGHEPGELVIRDGMDRLLGADHHTIVDVEWPGGRQQVVLEAGRREARLVLGQGAVQGRDGAWGGATLVSYLGLGVEHILLGFDHVLFVVALVLPGGSLGALLWVVSAFTLAHTATLALSVLDVVRVPATIVEPVIALSIAYVAYENVVQRSSQASRRAWVGFGFGLVHGLGFAGVLTDVGLPQDSIAAALIGFNVGVEVGQAAIILMLTPLLIAARRLDAQRRLVRGASLVLLAVGLGLAVERLIGGSGLLQ